jgi:hypothetical protein
MAPHEVHAESKPRKGDAVTYRGKHAGHVVRVEGNLCWVEWVEEHQWRGERTMPFIWCFKDGLNTLHDWPGKQRQIAA